MDEHFCAICNKSTKPFTTREQLAGVGWKGMEGRIDGHHYNFYFCEKHKEKGCVDYLVKWRNSLPKPKIQVTAINGKKLEDPYQKFIDMYKGE